MSFSVKNHQKRFKFARCFFYKNLHEIPFTIENITLFYTVNKEVSLKSLIKVSALLELITAQRAIFLRSKKSSVSLKIRKGAPLGVLVSLRRRNLSRFLSCLIWEVLPNVKNLRIKSKVKPSNNVLFSISDPLIFSCLKDFYLLFKSCSNLRVMVSFSTPRVEKETILNKRFALLPF
jgi:ribosomal protein L5